MSQKINIVLFGIGNIGSALINKAVKSRKALLADNGLDLRFPVITNSTVAFFEKEGKGYKWEANFIQFAIPFKLEDVIEYISAAGLENLIAIDATESSELVAEYINLINSGFSILSINNTLAKLPPALLKEIQIEADDAGRTYTFIDAQGKSTDKAAVALLEAIVAVAESKNVAA